ncbi:MAG TPA: hypothetical protein VIV11_36350 [Kofleriaceae bacterium]
MAKDRAAPFSKKHRKYWIPVTGGMLLIAGLNVALGFCTYEEPPKTERIELDIPGAEPPPPGTLRPSDLPAEVMRAFAIKYPHTIPAGANLVQGNYVVLFPVGREHKSAVFKPDGTFVSEEN